MKRILILTVVIMVACSIFSYDKPAYRNQYDFAHELFLNNNFKLAENLFKSFILNNPEVSLAGDARFMAAETQYNTGNYREALKSYIAITEKYPETRNKYRKEIYYRLAECYFQLKDYEESVRYIEILINNYPTSYLVQDAYRLL